MAVSFRYEPFPPARFPVGDGPFRARGLAYVMALRYVESRLPGGRAAFFDALGSNDPYAPFYDQLFLVTGDYDVSPLVRLYVACAQIEGLYVGRFIEERSRWSAESDTKGVWKPMLKASTPEEAAERSRLAFSRYFPPCLAVALSAEPHRFEGELQKLPAPMTGLYTSATVGFISAAVAMAGGVAPRVEFERAEPDGALSNVPVSKARFSVTWR